MVARNTPAHNVTRHNVPAPEDVERIFMIRKQTEALVETIVDVCPASADRSVAIRKARDAMMNAIASIVVDQGEVAALNRAEPTWTPDDTPESERPF